MLILKVTMLEGRSDEVRAELIRRLTAAAGLYLNEDPAEIRVVIYEVPPTDWGAGGVTLGAQGRK